MFFLFASDDVGGLQPTPENLEEISGAVEDLNDDPNMGSFGSGPYWPKIRARLLASSNSQDPKEAVAEWKYVRMWIDDGRCELCDHQPIKFHFQIENRVNGNRLVLGSECIYNYLIIPGVPSKEALKRRLNQLRAVAKAVAEGKLGEGAVAELENLQNLEREINILVGKVSRPDRDIDIKEFQTELWQPVERINLMGINTQGSQTVQAVYTSTRQLVSHLTTIAKRSTKYKPYLLMPAVEAIMRYRDLGDRKSSLETLQKYVNNVFKLGPAEEVIEMAWAEVRGAKKDAIALYLGNIDAAKKRAQDQYQSTLEQLKPYSHLSFIVQAGVNSLKATIDKEAEEVIAALGTIDGAGQIDRRVLSPWKLKGPDGYATNLGSVLGSVAKEAAATVLLLQRVSHPSNFLVQAIGQKFGLLHIKDIAGVTKAILDAADDGDIDMQQDWVYGATAALQNPKLLARLAEEVDDVKAKLREVDGRKVYEAMGEQLKFDVKKFYSNISMSDTWLVSFGKSIFAQWQKGLEGLSYKQRGIVDKSISKKTPTADSLWDSMQSDFNKRYTDPTPKFAEMEYRYGR